jgi:hypothetical protein
VSQLERRPEFVTFVGQYLDIVARDRYKVASGPQDRKLPPALASPFIAVSILLGFSCVMNFTYQVQGAWITCVTPIFEVQHDATEKFESRRATHPPPPKLKTMIKSFLKQYLVMISVVIVRHSM